MPTQTDHLHELVKQLREWSRALGFAELRIARPQLSDASKEQFNRHLALGRYGSMDYMARHAALRVNAKALLPEAQSVVLLTLPYAPTMHTGEDETGPRLQLAAANDADTDGEQRHFAANFSIARYARGRDYHTVMRQRLKKLCAQLTDHVARQQLPTAIAPTTAAANSNANADHPAVFTRLFCDTAPIMEKPLAQSAGLGWQGKHSLLMNRHGSYFFIGGFLCSLPLPADTPQNSHCGSCRRCIDACPTQAIVADGEVDARRCLAYWTIEHDGEIPVAWRRALGTHLYGCDDCQSACPWNRFAGRQCVVADFFPRACFQALYADNSADNNANNSAEAWRPLLQLQEFLYWSADDFNEKLAGSPIRRIGHERWLRNIAVVMGNLLASAHDHPDGGDIIRRALLHRRDVLPCSALVREHIDWALAQG